jgi:AcrR family transcriptional regulator
MISWRGDEEPEPTPEQLAAYADGELDGRPALEPLRRRVEAWLARHPDAAAEVEAQRRLARLWQATPPPEPSEAAWNDVLERLERVPRTPAETGRRRAAARVALWAGAALAASAAAVWLALTLSRPGHVPPAPPEPGGQERAVNPRPAPEADEPFPVATAEEVEILSIKGDDTETVLVGELPVSGSLVMADPGEVELTRAEPQVRMGDGPPMVWVQPDKDRAEQ